MYRAHLHNSSFLEKSVNFIIEYFGNFRGDGRITRSNPLPRGASDLGRFVIMPDNVNAPLMGANFPVTVFAVSDPASELQ